MKKQMKQKLSKTNGVYLLFRDEKVVYVGSSAFCESRIYEHIGKDFTHFQILKKTETGQSLKRIETKMIAKHSPEYNKNISCTLDFVSLKYRVGECLEFDPWANISMEVRKIAKPVFILNGTEYFYRTDVEKAMDNYRSNLACMSCK